MKNKKKAAGSRERQDKKPESRDRQSKEPPGQSTRQFDAQSVQEKRSPRWIPDYQQHLPLDGAGREEDGPIYEQDQEVPAHAGRSASAKEKNPPTHRHA